eukprot:1094730-Pelagomonas_calceolata.AAC.2
MVVVRRRLCCCCCGLKGQLGIPGDTRWLSSGTVWSPAVAGRKWCSLHPFPSFPAPGLLVLAVTTELRAHCGNVETARAKLEREAFWPKPCASQAGPIKGAALGIDTVQIYEGLFRSAASRYFVFQQGGNCFKRAFRRDRCNTSKRYLFIPRQKKFLIPGKASK